MSKYTAEDFANAGFAKNGSHRAARNYAGMWRTAAGDLFSSSEMADYGWTPVQESSELTICTLREEWEDAEIITADNLPREGDTIIRKEQVIDGFAIWKLSAQWATRGYQSHHRILRRKARPDGAAELEELLQTIWDAGMSLPEAADKLAEHVTVTDD